MKFTDGYYLKPVRLTAFAIAAYVIDSLFVSKLEAELCYYSICEADRNLPVDRFIASLMTQFH